MAGFPLYAHDISNEWLVSYKVVLAGFLSKSDTFITHDLQSLKTLYVTRKQQHC